MDRSARPAVPKDDDSWGKLASDLFGIDLGPQDDFDFADAEPVTTPAAPPPASVPEPIIAEDVAPPEASAPTDEPTESQAPTDDYWGALETWDWAEGEVAREKRSESGSSGDRSGRRDEGGRRGQRPRRGREESAGRDRERSGRSGGSARRREEAAPESPPREDRTPRAEETRSEATPAEAPRRPRRPRREEAAGSGAERPRPPKARKPIKNDDDFGAGLDEEFITEQDEWEAGPFEEAAAPISSEDDDDFGGGLEVSGSPERSRDADEGDDEDRPKRRRRRRRRRPAGDRTESAGAESATDEDRDQTDEEASSTTSSEEDFSDGDQSAEAEDSDDRPRRRRRRRRRRSGPTDGGEAVAPRTDDFDDAEVLETVPRRPQPTLEPGGAHLEEVFDGEEPEPIQHINYDDVPTWDEAISYLVRVREGDSRGRGQRESGGSPNRGRRPPQRRPRSDAPPEA